LIDHGNSDTFMLDFWRTILVEIVLSMSEESNGEDDEIQEETSATVDPKGKRFYITAIILNNCSNDNKHIRALGTCDRIIEGMI